MGIYLCKSSSWKCFNSGWNKIGPKTVGGLSDMSLFTGGDDFTTQGQKDWTYLSNGLLGCRETRIQDNIYASNNDTNLSNSYLERIGIVQSL